MSVETTPDHDELTEMLPDYAVGALSDADLARIARHLDGCAACRRELANLMETLANLVVAEPPSPAVKASLLARVTSQPRHAPSPVAAEVPAADHEPIPLASRRQPTANGRWARVAWLGAVAAVLIVALGAWNVSLQRQLDDQPERPALVSAAANVVPLTDSQLTSPATGVMVLDPASDEAMIVAEGLPQLSADQRFQVWLFTDDGERISAGLLAPREDGRLNASIRAPQPLGAYAAIAMSAEPVGGSAEPTTALVLGGWLAVE